MWAAFAAIAVAAALLVPEPEAELPELPAGRPFVWGADELWQALEHRFEAARTAGCEALAGDIEAGLARGRTLIASLAGREVPCDAPELAELERVVFELGPEIAACPAYLSDYAALVALLRTAVKEQSRGWEAGSQAARDRLYRLLYGSRAALEEAMLQAPAEAVPALLPGTEVCSSAPTARLRGVELRSGDVLVSRGGAPVSALIARGNDYPGNFSHIALLHVSESGEIALIESHIERGVAVAAAEQYISDVKLRIMVLRLRADHPALRADPLLPHRAAASALAEARRRHIPYDFAMDWRRHERMFCSEVAAAAYASRGVTLWSALSRISTPGTARWLAAFGVCNFVTQEPSDLEYDPQLAVIAEWRDPEVLFKDHIDNAVVDALLDAADDGLGLEYPRAMLPVVRLAKAYSAVLNLAGRVGPVPEGMSAGSALRARRLDELHGTLAADVAARAGELAVERGHRPPYWELVRLARESLAARRKASPAGGRGAGAPPRATPTRSAR
jgi:hypothetical protein